MKKHGSRIRFLIGILVMATAIAVIIAGIFIGNKKTGVVPEDPEPVQEYDFQERKEPVEVIELPAENEKTEAKEVAAAFVENFHERDAKDPEKYLQNSKQFMTADLFNDFRGIPYRGTLTAERVEVVSVEMLPAALEEDLQIWNVGTTATQVAADGSEGLVFTEYGVMLIKEKGKWKVDGVRINE